MGSANDQIASGLNARLEAFRQSDSDRNTLIEQLVHEYRGLEIKYAEKCDDYENEVSSRRHWQNNFATMKRDLENVREQNECNPFALALIDGDGAMFHDHLLKAAADGGSEAGHLLMGEIKKHLHERHGSGGNWAIMVQIYANFEGLSRKLAHIGVLRSPAELHTFARAFSCNQPLFSFIDVGSGKERADHKLKEMLRLFVSNSQCKHIIFGGCHDNGYLPNLEPLKRDEAVTSRMTLLETTTAERGFISLGMTRTRFASVFRDDQLPDIRPLPERHQPGLMGNSATSPFMDQTTLTNNGVSNTSYHHQVPTPVGTPKPVSVGEQASAGTSKIQEIENTPLPKAATVSPAPMSSKLSTYATVGRTDTASKQISIAPNKPAPPQKAVYINTYDERIDLTLPKPEQAAAVALHQRIKKMKVCNNFHLLGNCPAGRSCTYSHEPKLTAKEQIALKNKARDRPCGLGSSCRDADCLSGHHCPRGEDCGFEVCIFGYDSHYIDKTIKLRYLENGEIETVR